MILEAHRKGTEMLSAYIWKTIDLVENLHKTCTQIMPKKIHRNIPEPMLKQRLRQKSRTGNRQGASPDGDGGHRLRHHPGPKRRRHELGTP